MRTSSSADLMRQGAMCSTLPEACPATDLQFAGGALEAALLVLAPLVLAGHAHE